MRQSFRLLAAVNQTARYFESGAPTGLTGLLTSASARSSLLYLYASTLERLQPIPETSLYRQSVEAVTRHRLALVEATKPAGYDEWKARATALIEKDFKSDAWPNGFPKGWLLAADGTWAHVVKRSGETFVLRTQKERIDERDIDWDGGKLMPDEVKATMKEEDLWVDEPQLTIEQIEELENKIGAGLIEEVIQVAEGELAAIDTMVQSKVWESLEEKPREGQWSYFERKE